MGFFRSTSGRMVALSLAVASRGRGVSRSCTTGCESTFVLCISLFVPVVINTLGLPMALEKDWYHAALSAMLLPLFFFLWAVGIGSVRENYPWIAYRPHGRARRPGGGGPPLARRSGLGPSRGGVRATLNAALHRAPSRP